MRRRIFEIISKGEEGDLPSKLFDGFTIALIALSIVSIVMESFKDFALRHALLLLASEVFCVVFFTIEYLLRIWTADYLYPDARHPRLKYVLSFLAIMDLLAILPFYLPFLSVDLRYLRILRLFRLMRLLRVFKLGRYVDALNIIVDVIKSTASQLVISIVICFFVMLFSSIVMYTVENPVQPDQFPNIIASLWWAICTLTTVGYGDVYPITARGRFLAGIISKGEEGDLPSKLFDGFTIALIALSIVSIVVESFKDLAIRYALLLLASEVFCVVFLQSNTCFASGRRIFCIPRRDIPG